MSDKDISLDEIKTLLREKQNKINDMEAMSVKSRKKLELINKKIDAQNEELLQLLVNITDSEQDVSTMGLYIAYKTGMFQIDLGTGTGESDISTTRKDLGNDTIISGKTTADIDYQHARVAANFSRGRFTLVPSAAYRIMDVSIKAFTDDRADETLTITGDQQLFSTGNSTTGVTDDAIAARSVTSETISLGMVLSANLGKLVPYVDISYDSEDTTAAVYKAEAGTDGNNSESKASDYNTSIRMGAGLNFMLGSHISGGLRAGQITGRDDWTESYMAGNISIGF